MMRFNRVLLVSPGFRKGRWRLSLHPLTGLGYISESLKRSGFSVEVFDMNLKYAYKDLERKIGEFKPDLIGFTVMTFAHKDIYATINMVKKRYGSIKVVVGGPHVSMLREKVLGDCSGIDYGIVLEGDISIIELCNGVETEKIQGLIYRKEGGIVANKFDKFISDLDKIAFPKYESFELGRYPTGQMGIVTSRGCPYSCIYCPVISSIGKQFRPRSAENVVDEIEYWHRRGYREILVLDDNFTLSRERTQKICDLLGKKNFKDISLKCPNGIRADKVDYDLLKDMRSVGFDMVAFGVEAASDEVLKNIKKGEGIETIEKGIRCACDLGFDVDLFFLIGSPGESLDDFRSSLSLASRYPIRNALFYNIIPFPTTELFRWIEDNGYFLHPVNDIINDASHFTNEPCFFTPEMTAGDRKRAFRMAQAVSRTIRRRSIERKTILPVFLKRIFSWLYTSSFMGQFLISSRLLMRLKENMKRSILGNRERTQV